jgi:hypothetical protein
MSRCFHMVLQNEFDVAILQRTGVSGIRRIRDKALVQGIPPRAVLIQEQVNYSGNGNQVS